MTNWLAKLEEVEFAGPGRPDAVPTTDAYAILKEAVAQARSDAFQVASTLVLSRQIRPGIKLNDVRSDRHDDTLRSLARHLTQMAKGEP